MLVCVQQDALLQESAWLLLFHVPAVVNELSTLLLLRFQLPFCFSLRFIAFHALNQVQISHQSLNFTAAPNSELGFAINLRALLILKETLDSTIYVGRTSSVILTQRPIKLMFSF